MGVIGKIACVAAAVGITIVAARMASLGLSNTFWTTLWVVLLGIVAIPALLTVMMDSKGQAAAGWLMLMGMVISAVLAAIYLVSLGTFLIVSFVF